MRANILSASSSHLLLLFCICFIFYFSKSLSGEDEDWGLLDSDNLQPPAEKLGLAVEKILTTTRKVYRKKTKNKSQKKKKTNIHQNTEE